jgi:putative transposase
LRRDASGSSRAREQAKAYSTAQMKTNLYKPSYRRNLPHLQPPGATIFVTFRLAGSLPRELSLSWQAEMKRLEGLDCTDNQRYQQRRRWFAKFEAALHKASNSPVWLKNENVASIVAENFHRNDSQIFRLDAYCIMPNHVHAVIAPLRKTELEYVSLATMMQLLKGRTSREANLLLGRSGPFWAQESYDHVVRDAEEWQRIVAYVLNNPVKAGLVKDWKDWKWSYRRETIPL